MIVAVDIRSAEEEYQNFILQTFGRITKTFTQHSFFFIFDEPHDASLIFSKNVIPVVIKRAKLPLLSQVVTDKKVAAVLKKYKAEVFVTPTFISLTNVPQCLIYNKKISEKALTKAKAIVTPSAFSKDNIIEKYKIWADKIDVVYAACDEEFQPIDFIEREKLKEEYADGNEYFFYKDENASSDNLLNLLKAFSIFKKRQKSNMQLLFASTSEFDPSFLEQLNLYKFKSDVKILGGISKSELANITAAAYAAIYFNNANTFYFPALEAIKCDVPVITSNAGVLPEIFSDAALYAKIENNKAFAEKMMLIFKDERLRRELIEKGKQQIKKFSWDIVAEQLWESIEKAIK
jgi:glycosyltransferase involved in cell wall biosynthesis